MTGINGCSNDGGVIVTAGNRVSRLFLAGMILIAAVSASAYDYTETMKGFRALPLEYPEMPFVFRFTQEELLSQPIWSQRVDGLLIPRNAPSPIRVGADQLQKTLVKLKLGEAPVIEVDPNQEKIPELAGKHIILLGVPESFALVRSVAAAARLEITDQALNGDGFVIKPTTLQDKELLLITSPAPRGVLYGAYELEERTTHRGVPRIDDTFVPAVRYRSWAIHNFLDEPLGACGRWRFNISLTLTIPWPGTLVYNSFPELGGEQNRDAILANQQALRRKFQDAARYGAMPALLWNPMSLQLAPEGSTFEKLYAAHPGMQAKPSKFRQFLCPSDPATRQFLVDGVREIAQAFPELEWIIPVWSDDGGELNCGCDRCAQYPFIDRVVDYTKLLMDTARSINPRMRFMLHMHALDWFIPEYHPEYANDPTRGLGAVRQRLGNDVEEILNLVTTPPGMDLQSWLFGKETTMLGSGVPTFLLFHYYEAGGPGIVAPLSPVQTHLSWALPIYLEKLRKCVQPFQGVVGGMSPQGGMEVAWWYPDLDPHKFMRNWCRARYGEAGEYVYQALVDTHKITEAFFMNSAPETFNLYRWGPYPKPWSTPMAPSLAKLGFRVGAEESATFEWNEVHARPPEELKTITLEDKARWLDKFAVDEEIAIAERAETMTAKAAEISPDNPELQYLLKVAKATNDLIHLFREYHQAMVCATVARNTPDEKAKAELVASSREHMKLAINLTADYNGIYGLLVDRIQKQRRSDYVEGCAFKDEGAMQFHRLYWDVHNVFLPCLLSIVREAAFLHDQEFAGASLLRLFDQKLGIAP